MKITKIVLGFLLGSSACAGLSHADPHFYNATPGAYKVVATLPNGAKDDRQLSSGASALTQESFTLAAGVKEIKVDILDDAGASVWKGTVKSNAIHVIVPAKSGVKVVYAGYYGSTSTPNAIVAMNATGEPLTIDLEGRNGLSASRGNTQGTSFDTKKLIKLDARESTYGIKGKSKGADIAIDGTVAAGRYLLLWKNATGTYHGDTIGTINE